MAWNVDEAPKGRKLIDGLGSRDSEPLTAKLPRQLASNIPQPAFVEAGCRIVTRLYDLATRPTGKNLNLLFEQTVHAAPSDRPHSYIYPLRTKNKKTPISDDHVRLSQQGTGYFHPKSDDGHFYDDAEFDEDNPRGLLGVIVSTMNAKSADGRFPMINGRMSMPEGAALDAPLPVRSVLRAPR